MEKFTIGLVLGAIGGAYAVANNYKMRTLVRKGQEEIKERFDEMLDEKLEDIREGGCIFPSKSKDGEEAEEPAVKKTKRSAKRKEAEA